MNQSDSVHLIHTYGYLDKNVSDALFRKQLLLDIRLGGKVLEKVSAFTILCNNVNFAVLCE